MSDHVVNILIAEFAGPKAPESEEEFYARFVERPRKVSKWRWLWRKFRQLIKREGGIVAALGCSESETSSSSS